ncbi:uncharacterized protein LOC143255755 [Tachypleus tridentatus]|uniref:uncharacterized protein LOC143255755 n=1 Tax=Tachypleus tridentatus TaxID=6853 RepID=UPI003FD58A47
MNSAAVIGRQLRQHNTNRISGPVVPPTPLNRTRAKNQSHQPLYPLLNYPPGQQGKSSEEEKKPKGLAALKSKLSWGCCWRAVKSFSGGVLLIMVGIAMSVVGFYAGPLSLHEEHRSNETVKIINKQRQFHLHNLTYVGPAIMGIGGIVLVAASVMFESKDTSAKVVPSDQRPGDTEAMLSEYVLDGQISLKDSSTITTRFGNYLTVPNSSPFFPTRKQSVISILSERKMSHVPQAPSKPPSPLKVQKCRPTLTLPMKPWPLTPSIQSPQVEDEFVPSPQDIELPDPDGCETPIRCSLDSMDLELYATDCPLTVSVQLETQYLTSQENDDLLDKEVSDLDQSSFDHLSDLDKDEAKEPLLNNKPFPSKGVEDLLLSTKLKLSEDPGQASIGVKINSSKNLEDNYLSNKEKGSEDTEAQFLDTESWSSQESKKGLLGLQMALSIDLDNPYVCINPQSAGISNDTFVHQRHSVKGFPSNMRDEPPELLGNDEEEEENEDEQEEQIPLIKNNKIESISSGEHKGQAHQLDGFIQMEDSTPIVTSRKPFLYYPSSNDNFVQMNAGSNPQQALTDFKEKVVGPIFKMEDSCADKVKQSLTNGRKCGISS